jgi:hypothetical protein
MLIRHSFQRQLFATLAVLLALGTQNTTPARADGQGIMDASGNSFMEEETPAPKPQRRMPNSRMNVINGDNTRGDGTASTSGRSIFDGTNYGSGQPRRPQSIQTSSGGKDNMFMEEVSTPSSKGTRPYVDLSNVGVQVDPSGNAVPLIDHSGSPVRPLYSNTQAYQEMPVPIINQTADNPLALPYTIDGQQAAVGTTFIPVTPGTVPFLRPSYNPYNGNTSFNPYSTGGISPYGGYGGFGGYGGVGPYGYGGSGINLNIGRLHIGSGPYDGYPGYGGFGYPGGYNHPGYGYGGYTPGFGGLGYGGMGAGGLFGRPGFGFGRRLLGGLGGLGGYGYGGGYPLLGYNSALGYAGPGYGSFIGGGGILGYDSGFYGNNPYYSPAWQQNPATWGGTGMTSSTGMSLSVPVPIERNVQSTYGTSTLMQPVLRDPATSTGDLLEDAKRAGLWGNTTGQNNYRQGPLGGFSGNSGMQDQGVTNGAGFR